MYSFYFFVFFFVVFNRLHAEDKPKSNIKKDPRDFTENDVNNLFEQWEVRLILFIDGIIV